MQWSIYLLQCADGTLYCGSTNDLARRLHEHNHSAKGARYTRTRRPVTLRYHEPCANRSHACQREYEIKKMSRAAKQRLIQSHTIETERASKESQTPQPN